MKTSNSLLYTQLKRVAILAVCLFVFCECLIYYLVIFQCSWPEIDLEGTNRRFEPLKTMMLTDTHLLGPKHGHWFDKLRREWQMERAFQTAISHFQPDVVFLLGDLFDEGMTSNDEVGYHDDNVQKNFRTAPDVDCVVPENTVSTLPLWRFS